MAAKSKKSKSFKKYFLLISVFVCLVVILVVTGYFYRMGPSTSRASASVNISPQPSVTVLSGVALHDATVTQSFAYDAPHKVWIFSQVMGSGRLNTSWATHLSSGDMTLTKISPAGKILGYMYLVGFGHGSSIGVEPVGSKLYVWTEAVAYHGYGRQIARFEWKNSATISPYSAGVTLYGVNANAAHQTPFVDAANDLIGVRYYSSSLKVDRWAIYRLSAFKNKNYTPLVTISEPPIVSQERDHQGWALDTTQGVIEYTGLAYSSTNVAPGNTKMSLIDTKGKMINQIRVTVAPNLVFREPEGLTNINGNICAGFTSGNSGARKANVFCQSPVK